MSLKVLTPDEVDQFIEHGYVMLPEAFPRTVAAAIREAVLGKFNVREDDRSTWPARMHHLCDSFPGEPFMSAITKRFTDAVDDLVGEGRWEPLQNLGWWPCIFPGYDTGEWAPIEESWHVDGGFFHHHLDSPEQALLPIFLLSDIGPGNGGTAFAPGSHKVCARILRDAQPAGMSAGDIARTMAAQPRPEVREATGRAGDIALMHPFMAHAISKNVGPNVRIICNPHISLANERLNVTADPARPFSPVEQAIYRAIEETPAVR